MTKTTLLLIAICVLFLFTRFYQISSVPPSVYWDEASIGYNAYSILNTGKDEWGKSFPVHFRAFGEFKLPVFIYSAVLPIWVFGLNEFSLRFTSVIFSFVCLIGLFLLTNKIFKNKKVALLSVFFLTISPGIFIFSRTGYEATAGLAFYILAIYFFILSKERKYFSILSIIFFVITMYSYNSYRIITPLTLLPLFINQIISDRKKVKNLYGYFLSLIILVIGLVPIYRFFASPESFSRFQAVGITNYSKNIMDLLSTFILNLLSHFNWNFLFLNGDINPRSQQPGFGQLYILDLIFLVLGALTLFKSFKKNIFIFYILFISLIPSALTTEAPHALRTLSVVPFLSIISAVGIIYLTNLIKFRFLLPFLVVIYFILFGYYFINFTKTYSLRYSRDWQFEYKQIFLNYRSIFNQYDQIYISDMSSQPYIFQLFYLKEDPEDFVKNAEFNSLNDRGFSKIASFNKFNYFKNLSDLKLDSTKKTLIFTPENANINKELNFKNLKLISEIKYLDGKLAFFVYEQIP